MVTNVEHISVLVRPLLERMQVKLCGVRLSGRISRPLIQIFVDWEESPITIKACADISRQIQDIFDLQERFAPDYRLEVSSPGLDAPLTELWQFRRNIGHYIGGINPEGQYEVRLVNISPEGILTVENNEGVVTAPMSDYIGAKVILFPKHRGHIKRKRNEARGS